MWLCARCGESHEETFEACWKCGAARSDESAQAAEDESASGGDDRAEIDMLVDAFFEAFSNVGGAADVRRVYYLCLPNAVITKAVGELPETYLLHEFVEPRVKLLDSAELTEFSERETSNDTFIFGRIAQRRSSYTKSGLRAGERFTTNGTKVFQFVKTPAGWKISAMAWDDQETSK